MKKNRIAALALAALLLLPALALAKEVTQKTDFGGGFYEISYFASEQDKKEAHPLRTEYYNGKQLQSSKVYKTLEDGTLRTDNLDADGKLMSYSLFKTEDGQAVTRDYDAQGALLSSSTQTANGTINTVAIVDEQGKQTGTRVITNFTSGLIRYEELDAQGALLYYELETPGRKDRYDADGKLQGLILSEPGENGAFVEYSLDARGESIGHTVRSTDKAGVTRLESYNPKNELTGYTLTKMTDAGIQTETYDASGALLSTQQDMPSN